ncbi:MAG: hypothetical protein GXO74_05405 [Calditrichaeota bacterium]|nr:hypothetical protein [Calditrichota bacterium]
MIEYCSFGKIIIDGVTYRRDVIVTPEKVIPDWWRRKGHELCVADIASVIEKYQPELLIVGTGQFGLVKILRETQEYLQGKSVRLISQKTGKAYKLYNEASGKATVVGAFHLTC